VFEIEELRRSSAIEFEIVSTQYIVYDSYYDLLIPFSCSFRSLCSRVRLHAMHLRVPCPLSERLSIKPENDSRQAEEKDQTHVRHDRRDVSALDDPRSDELREAVSPDVLVNRNGNED
jgi:hypothetical protein